RRVGRVCPQRAGVRSGSCGGALGTDAPYRHAATEAIWLLGERPLSIHPPSRSERDYGGRVGWRGGTGVRFVSLCRGRAAPPIHPEFWFRLRRPGLYRCESIIFAKVFRNATGARTFLS